ncbi:MAG: LysM peptidoglycan-binding domain-containing protein [Acidimicrobiales bacterium]
MAMTAPLDFTPTLPTFDRPLPVYEAPRARTNRPASVRHHEPRPSSSINGLLAVVIGLGIVVVAVMFFGGGAAANGPLVPASADSQVSDSIEIYVVQPGDTLWAIAARVAPEGTDVRDVVDRLRVSAGTANLDVGQRIIIDHANLTG